jgi:hypothetical protein
MSAASAAICHGAPSVMQADRTETRGLCEAYGTAEDGLGFLGCALVEAALRRFRQTLGIIHHTLL